MSKKRKPTREEWEQQNCFDEPKSCFNCGFYKHGDDLPIMSDHKKDTDKSLCRAMREDGVKDYYFDDNCHRPDQTYCERWFTDGYR